MFFAIERDLQAPVELGEKADGGCTDLKGERRPMERQKK